MRHDLFGAVIGEGQKAAAFGHHGGGALADGGEGIDRDVHRHGEPGARGVNITTAQFVLVGKADGVNQEINLAPFGRQFVKERIDAVVACDIAFDKGIHPNGCGQRFDPLLQRFALI